MVFFTCNHCGESVKKPSVEKHYNTKCRGAPKSISCMDCQKDFQDNYVEHVKCITELEKYSGKDYVPRESANSGAKKQEGWVETVRAVLDSSEYELSKTTRLAFEMLQKYDNVPRKKAKFLNFVTNSVRIPRKTVEEVWNVLEKEQEKLKKAKQEKLEAEKLEKQSKENESEPKKKKHKLEQNGHDDENEKHSKKAKADDDSNENESTKVKKNTDASEKGVDSKQEKKLKKKQKRQDIQDEGNAEAKQQKQNSAETESEANDDANSNKKKKKKQSASAEVTTNGNVNSADENVSKKKKKKDTACVELENLIEADPDVTQKKKKKKSQSLEKGDATDEQLKENGNIVEKTQKKKRAASHEEPAEVDTPKKKQKLNGEAQNDNMKSKNNKTKTNTVQNEKEEDEAYTFCWDFEITNTMSKYSEGIELEKFKKKILKKYKTKFGSELNERQQHGFEKKFNKKLLKNNLLKVEGNLVNSVS